jgi:hypothetical protein
MQVDGRADGRRGGVAAHLDLELVGTCAFIAAYLRGVAVECLWEHERDRGFGVFGEGVNQPRIWDPLRHSFVYLDPQGDGWRLYDFASAHHLQVRRVGDELRFADQIVPTWSVRVRVHEPFILVSGPDGEHNFRTRPPAPVLHALPAKLEALPDPLVRDAPLPSIAL